MRRFTQLYYELDATNRTSEKLAALERYFAAAPARDAAWAVVVISGGKLIRAISSRRLRDLAVAETGYAPWLIGECYDAVGDLAETLALLLPGAAGGTDRPLQEVIETYILPLPRLDERRQQALVTQAWCEFDDPQRFVFHKMILGSLRVGVASTLLMRALANVAGVDPGVMAHRLSGQFTPSAEAYERIMRDDDGAGDPARPYPFYLAHALEAPLESLGDVHGWQAEWKWDGIRAQLIRRGEVLIWSRGSELITDAFPELRAMGAALPDGTVLDGEILAWEEGRPLPFALLQRRINRKREEPRLWDEVPVVFMAYDLLEHADEDLRTRPLLERRALLETLVAKGMPERLRLSPVVAANTWGQLEAAQGEARERGAEGLMLKRRSSPYGVGRQRGDWWKWKVDPYSVDAVLIYAQHGNGKRASLFTDYTFGVWEGGELVPVAKAYSGLSDAEIRQVDAFVRRNTVDRFGPVRVVKPELVFELAFEGIQASSRHRSGLALRFPRMARWRKDKTSAEADTLGALRALLRRREEQML